MSCGEPTRCGDALVKSAHGRRRHWAQAVATKAGRRRVHIDEKTCVASHHAIPQTHTVAVRVRIRGLRCVYPQAVHDAKSGPQDNARIRRVFTSHA